MKNYSIPFKVYLIYKFTLLQKRSDVDYYLDKIKEEYEDVFDDYISYKLANGKAVYTTHVDTYKGGSFIGKIKGREQEYSITENTKVQISGQYVKSAWQYWKEFEGEKLFSILIEQLKMNFTR